MDERRAARQEPSAGDPAEPFDAEAALDDFLDQLADVTPLDARAMVAAWDEVDAAKRTAAWERVREEARSSGRDDLLDAARQAVLRWSQQSTHALEGSPYSVTQGDDMQRLESRLASARPVLDGAAATILSDRLEPEQFDTLYAPWAVGTEEVDDDAVDFEFEAGTSRAADGPAGARRDDAGR